MVGAEIILLAHSWQAPILGLSRTAVSLSAKLFSSRSFYEASASLSLAKTLVPGSDQKTQG